MDDLVSHYLDFPNQRGDDGGSMAPDEPFAIRPRRLRNCFDPENSETISASPTNDETTTSWQKREPYFILKGFSPTLTTSAQISPVKPGSIGTPSLAITKRMIFPSCRKRTAPPRGFTNPAYPAGILTATPSPTATDLESG